MAYDYDNVRLFGSRNGPRTNSKGDVVETYTSFIKPEMYEFLVNKIEEGGRIVLRYTKMKDNGDKIVFLDFVSKEEVDKFNRSESAVNDSI